MPVMALYIRSIEESERAEIEDGLRSQNGIWARRCQVLWNSSRGKKVKEIAEMPVGIPRAFASSCVTSTATVWTWCVLASDWVALPL